MQKLFQCVGGPSCSSYHQLAVVVVVCGRNRRAISTRSFKLMNGRTSPLSPFCAGGLRQLNILTNVSELEEKKNALEATSRKNEKESLNDIESGLTLNEYSDEVMQLKQKSGWSFQREDMSSMTGTKIIQQKIDALAKGEPPNAVNETTETELLDTKMERRLELKRRREQLRSAPNKVRSSAHLFHRGLMELNEWSPMEVFEAIKKDFYRLSKDAKPLSQLEKEEFYKEHEIVLSTEKIPDPCMAMNDLQFSTVLKARLRRTVDTLMPVQSLSWPILLSGKNMLGIAPTGSGKSLGFIVPGLIHCGGQETVATERSPTLTSSGGGEVEGGLEGEGDLVAPAQNFCFNDFRQTVEKRSKQMLIISPTRELTEQLNDVTARYQHTLNLTSYNCSGGLDRRSQERDINRVNHILLGTPGRLMDFLRLEMVSLKKCSFVVLDEADRLLNMGFEPQIKTIFSYLRPDCQVSMFSATFNDVVEKLARQYIGENGVVARIGGHNNLTVNRNIEQHVEVLHLYDRELRLQEVIQTHRETHGNEGKVLVFVKDGPTAEKLANDLFVEKGWNTYAVYGELLQRKRQYRFGVFRYKPSTILVSTDLGAIGLDIENIDLVVNFDFPMEMEDYVHRIGRTARGTKKGTAVSFISRRDQSLAKPLIELLKRSGQTVTGDLINLKARAGGEKPRTFGYRAGLTTYRYTNEDLPEPVMPEPEPSKDKIHHVKSETEQAAAIQQAMDSYVADGEHRDNLRLVAEEYEDHKNAIQWVQRKAMQDANLQRQQQNPGELAAADESVNLLSPGVLYLDPELYGDSFHPLHTAPRLSYKDWAKENLRRQRSGIGSGQERKRVPSNSSMEQLDRSAAKYITNKNEAADETGKNATKDDNGEVVAAREPDRIRTAAEIALINWDYQESLRTFKPKGSRKTKRYDARVERQQRQLRSLLQQEDDTGKSSGGGFGGHGRGHGGGHGGQFDSGDREFIDHFSQTVKGTRQKGRLTSSAAPSFGNEEEDLTVEERKKRLYTKGEYDGEREKRFDLYEYDEWKGFKPSRDSAITRSKTPNKKFNNKGRDDYPW